MLFSLRFNGFFDWDLLGEESFNTKNTAKDINYTNKCC
jgi:hypothetical protein